MSEYKASMRRYSQYFLFLWAFLVLGWGFTPYQSIFLGAIIGSLVSYYNLWNMLRKVEKVGQAVTKGQKVYSIGTLSRLGFAALAIIIAMKYPDMFHYLSVIIGLMSAYIIIFLDILVQKIYAKLKER